MIWAQRLHSGRKAWSSLVLAAALASLAGLPRAAAQAGKAGGAAPDSAVGLVGWWRFDEGRGYTSADSAGSDYAADISGAEWVRGAFGTALRFTGRDSYAVIPELEGVDGSDELTVQAWVYWEGTGRYPNVLSGGVWSPGGFMLFVSDRSCRFRMGRPGHRAGRPDQDWKEVSCGLVHNIETGRWRHLAATFKRPHITTYLDGRKVGAAKWDFPVGHSGDILVGKWGAGACHNGLIDEVMIHNRALSGAEIEAVHAREAPRRAPVPGGKAYEPAPGANEPDPVLATFETELARLTIDVRGRCVELIDKATGQNCLTGPSSLVGVRCGSRWRRPVSCSLDNGRLTFRFPGRLGTAVVAVTAKQRHFTFEVASTDVEGAEELTFLDFTVRPSRYVSRVSTLADDEEVAVCLQALNLETLAVLGGRPPRFRASCFRKYGMAGAKAALVAAPSDRMREALKEVVRQEGLPYSTLGGPFSLDAEDCRGSYLFSRVSESNVEDWIDVARRAGFTHVHYSGWCQSLGHYEPRKALFPNGLEGMKATVAKIHGAGLKAGMHTLTGCVATNDPWVTPVPDKRLVADATYTLAEAMDEKSTVMLTLERPGKHDTVWTYAGNGNAIRIGDEIIRYSAISCKPPYGFLECERGAFRTKSGAHAKGARVDHLQQRYLAFYPEENSTLVGEVADAIARVYNECEMDQIYMDGAEGMRGWRPVAVMRRAIYDRLKRPALVEASSWGAQSWPFHSRIGAWDHPKWGLKRFTDMHCDATRDYRKSALLEAQLGWWAILGPARWYRAELPDEIEYLCCKALAMDAPMSIQGVRVGVRPPNARQSEYFTTVGRYERLRLANYFTEAVRARLAEPRQEFRLIRSTDGEWRFVPTDYDLHKVTGLHDGSQSWTVENRFREQPVRLRIEALHSVFPYESADASEVADFQDVSAFVVQRKAPSVTHRFEPCREEVKVGAASARFTAENSGDSRRGAWARAGRLFEPHLDLGHCRAFGLWVQGDGKGQVLNVQFSNPREYSHSYAEHYVKIDFTGWRYFELLLRERDAAHYHDYEWPYYSQHGIFRNRLVHNHVSELNLYLNNLPPGESATVRLSPIRALRTSQVRLRNPTIEIGGGKLAFPTVLNSGWYIEFDSMSDCRLYNERGALLKRLSPQGRAPILTAGENRVAFACEGPEGMNARAEVTVISSGAPFGGRAPADAIDWARLDREYEHPHHILALDGKETEWETSCRPGAESAALEVELLVEQVGLDQANYNAGDAVAIETFDNLEGFAGSAENQFAKYVHDGKHRGISTKPGVTAEFEPETKLVRVGKSSARYTASSARKDRIGWCARGRRFGPPLDLSECAAIGFWLHGDGRGESFKLQLRDLSGMWHDMVTRVDFTGWRYIEFELAGAKPDLSKTEYVILYYNGIPSGQTVDCVVDDIRGLRRAQRLATPTLSVNGRRTVFPVAMSDSSRLVFRSMQDCTLHPRTGPPSAVCPTGVAPMLSAGRNRVGLEFGPSSPREARVVVSLTKIYRKGR